MQFELNTFTLTYGNVNGVGEMCNPPTHKMPLFLEIKIGGKETPSLYFVSCERGKKWWERWMDWSLRCYWSQREKKIEETRWTNSVKHFLQVNVILFYSSQKMLQTFFRCNSCISLTVGEKSSSDKKICRIGSTLLLLLLVVTEE
jgi:hypothetical protein